MTDERCDRCQNPIGPRVTLFGRPSPGLPRQRIRAALCVACADALDQWLRGDAGAGVPVGR